MKTPISRFASHRAFSLIELIVVMVIIAILATFIAPAASTMIRGSQVTQASQILTDQVSQARQLALTENKSVEVRFIQFADPETPGESVSDPTTGRFRAMQIMEVTPTGTCLPWQKVQILPQAIMFNPNAQYSTILGGAAGMSINPIQANASPPNSDPPMPRDVKWNYKYVAFRFFSDGSTSLGIPQTGSSSAYNTDNSATTWFVTLHAINDLPKISGASSFKNVNFFTLQIDPISGATMGFRPTAL